MVNSIKQNGILEPIIVRPNGENFTILSGHNRANAAEIAEFSEVPCLVISDISDDEASLIVSGTNLNQRSFSDMAHSERAFAIKLYFDAIKALGGQGKRTDLVDFFTGNDNGSTSVQVEQKLTSRKQVSEKFGLSATAVQRYNRITLLISEFLDMLDSGGIGLVPQ
jgi:ParB family chromosome partitioning protein